MLPNITDVFVPKPTQSNADPVRGGRDARRRNLCDRGCWSPRLTPKVPRRMPEHQQVVSWDETDSADRKIRTTAVPEHLHMEIADYVFLHLFHTIKDTC